MFLRPCFRSKNGKRHAYWALVESVRTQRGPRQRVVAYLGDIDEAQRLGLRQVAEPCDTRDRQQSLLEEPTAPQYVQVDVSKVRVENCREFGGPWLAWQLIQKLGLDEFLRQSLTSGLRNGPGRRSQTARTGPHSVPGALSSAATSVTGAMKTCGKPTSN